ncbi:MAG: hypothetical protein JNJ61_02160 [Anaerolineae bacterium]|nr:hypothetical protein [Anaerolineae bacterium]
MDYLAATLRAIADQCGLKPLKQVALLPGVRAAYRLTVRYHDRRAHDSVATLRLVRVGGPQLEVVYRALFDHKPVHFAIETTRVQAFEDALITAHFDHLRDAQNLPPHGADLWLLERAAGGFYHSVLLAPELTGGGHARVVYIVASHLPEALREVQP